MKYLFTEFCGIGDLIHITPIIKTLSEVDGQAEIYLIGDNRWGALDIVENSRLITYCYNVRDSCHENRDDKYHISQITRFYRNNKSLIRCQAREWLNKNNFDVVFETLETDLPDVIEHGIRSSNARKFIRHGDRSGKRKRNLGEWYRERKSPTSLIEVPHKTDRHDIDSNYDLLTSFMEIPDGRSYGTWIDVTENVGVLEKYGLVHKQYLCMQPGAANGQPTPKTWHPTNFLTLCEKLQVAYPDRKIVNVGDRGDFDKTIRGHNWPSNVVNTAGKTNLNELCQIIRSAECVIAHDSGIMHIANALDCDLIALYGPTNHKATKPLGKRSEVIFSKNDAFLAMYHEKKSERVLAKEYPNHSAMSGISVEAVFEKIIAIMER